jgi:hypothetical protein
VLWQQLFFLHRARGSIVAATEEHGKGRLLPLARSERQKLKRHYFRMGPKVFMNNVEPTPDHESSNVRAGSESREMSSAGVWLKDLSLGAVLVLTVIGVAYTSYSRRPIVVYWDLLAPLIALVCVAAGWHKASAKDSRFHLIRTQTLHWVAFIVVMNVLLLSSVQRILGVSADGLAMLTLLALGTFTAGVHVNSLRICLLGLLMVLGVPAIAWVEESAAILVLIAGLAIAICAIVWWQWRKEAN